MERRPLNTPPQSYPASPALEERNPAPARATALAAIGEHERRCASTHVAGGAAALMSSPLAIKAAINAGELGSNIAPGLLNASEQIGSRALGRRMTRGK